MNTREKIILLGDNLIRKKDIMPLVLVIYQKTWVLKMHQYIIISQRKQHWL
jgi:hypothetical protein